MMNRLAVVLVVVLLYSYAEAKGAKCAKPAVKTTSQITLYPPEASSSGQFSFPGNGNCGNNGNGKGTPNCGVGNGNGQGNAAPQVSIACNCTKGQAVYNIIGSALSNASVTGQPAILVACNSTKMFCMKGTNGKKYKLKKPANLLSPPVMIFSYVNANGKAKNLAVLNCPPVIAGGNSSSVAFNKKAGFNSKWNCKKQNGAKGTKASPIFGSKKGKKYIKVASVSCSGCKPLKACKVASSTSG